MQIAVYFRKGNCSPTLWFTRISPSDGIIEWCTSYNIYIIILVYCSSCSSYSYSATEAFCVSRGFFEIETFEVVTRPSLHTDNFYNQYHHISIICAGLSYNKCNYKPSNFESQYWLFEFCELQFLRNKIINIVASHALQALGYKYIMHFKFFEPIALISVLLSACEVVVISVTLLFLWGRCYMKFNTIGYKRRRTVSHIWTRRKVYWRQKRVSRSQYLTLAFNELIKAQKSFQMKTNHAKCRRSEKS